MKKMRRLLAFTLLTAAALAQAPKGPARKASAKGPVNQTSTSTIGRFPIESIHVVGSKLYPEAAILSLTGLRAGLAVDPKVFDQAQQTLSSHGAFSGVSYRYVPAKSGQGYDVTFEVVDTEQVLPMRFDRLQVNEPQLRAALAKVDPLFRDKIPGTNEVIDRYRAAVEKETGQKVQAKVSSDDGNDLFIQFYPAGVPPTIAEVHFTGADVIPLYQLQQKIAGVAVGQEYTEKRFRELLEMSIRPMYEARGRVRVKFPKVAVAPASNVKGLKVIASIDEGPSYSFGDIHVRGAGSIDDELIRSAGLKVGELANLATAELARDRIGESLKRTGHMKVTSKTLRHIDDEKRTVDITYEVDPGPVYRFGKLSQKGLDLHGEHEIRRIWIMKQGEPYNGEYPQYFLNRLQEDGIFDNLQNSRFTATPDHRNLTVDVTLIFNESHKPLLKTLP